MVQGLLKVRVLASLLLAALVVAGAAASAQEPTDTKPAEPANVHGRLLLVLPFENRSGVGNLDWVSEAFPDILNRRLNSAGFLTIGRGDRLYAFDHLGLPGNLEPTRATAIRIAQMLDADYVVFGHYAMSGQGKPGQAGQPTGNGIVATAEVLDVTALRLGPALTQSGSMDRLPDMINELAWQVTRQLDPAYSVEEQTFAAADRDLPEDAFQDYLQGLVGDSPEQNIADLQNAATADPRFTPGLLALGRAYFSGQDYDQAATALGRVPKDTRDALEAEFYRGLAFFYTGNYKEAEDSFGFVSNRLPLPEVVNNQGVAESRRGKDAAALFQQAVAADPRDPDYHFNLAVALAHRGDAAGAEKELEETLKLRPEDQEAQQYAVQLKEPAKADPDPGHAVPDEQEPLERIKRGYSEAGFRQAAFELEQVQQMRLASLPPAERAATLLKDGDQFFQRGLVLEAEREYREALAADGNSALAHAGLAAVRERDGDAAAARQEAHASIQLQPNVPAYLVLARLDLQANQLSAAAADVGDALKVAPDNANARGMKLALQQRGQTIP
ncbi:MAG TPA: tetratricopeptide repeat protein [Acidobacteriaceae bacterium]|nr:tetratricopeptide repeat protein [Acidobacteriaceae bacterium]